MTRWTHKQIARLLELKAAGATLAQIAVELGHSRNSVVERWRRHGQPRRYHRATAAILARIRRLAAAGHHAAAIARRLGISEGLLSRWRYRHGLELPDGRGPGGSLTPEHRRRVAVGVQDAWRRKAASLGWPMANSPTQARLLSDVLAGANTTARMRALGRDARVIFSTLKALLALGYLSREHDGRQYVYTIAPYLLESREVG